MELIPIDLKYSNNIFKFVARQEKSIGIMGIIPTTPVNILQLDVEGRRR